MNGEPTAMLEKSELAREIIERGTGAPRAQLCRLRPRVIVLKKRMIANGFGRVERKPCERLQLLARASTSRRWLS